MGLVKTGTNNCMSIFQMMYEDTDGPGLVAAQ